MCFYWNQFVQFFMNFLSISFSSPLVRCEGENDLSDFFSFLLCFYFGGESVFEAFWYDAFLLWTLRSHHTHVMMRWWVKYAHRCWHFLFSMRLLIECLFLFLFCFSFSGSFGKRGWGKHYRRDGKCFGIFFRFLFTSQAANVIHVEIKPPLHYTQTYEKSK